MSNVVGLAGYAGSGKDTAAMALIERGYRRVAFADALKEMALKIDPLVLTNPVTTTSGCVLRHGLVRMSQIVAELGWHEAKRLAEVRRFLQELGSTVREYDPGFWIDYVDDGVMIDYREKYVITDARFENEGNFVQNGRDGLLLWIDRPGVGPCNSHCSESGELREMADAIIVNDGTVEELHRKVLEFVGL